MYAMYKLTRSKLIKETQDESNYGSQVEAVHGST